MSDSSEPETPSVGTRWPEAAVAILLQLIALIVIRDSLRVGIDWADDGPRAGYFPFYIGLLLLGSASWILFDRLRAWGRDKPFAERAQLRQVISMLVPMVVYVAGISVLGIYVASVALILFFMVRHGRYAWPRSTAVAIGVPLVFFLIFERWFLVPLPKGPLEQWFGI